MELLEFVLTTTYFLFRGDIYQQKFGMAIGSPVFPIMANLFMEFLEQMAIAKAPITCTPKLWKRYVDDVLEIIAIGCFSELTNHLNKTDTTGGIQFTHDLDARSSRGRKMGPSKYWSIETRGINVKHFYSGVVQVQDPSGMDLLKLTCKQKENWTVEKVSRIFTVLSFNSNHNLYVQSQENQLRIL